MTVPPDPRLSQLHGAARALAEELGYDMGVKFMIDFGGQQLSIPKRPMPRTSKIWRALGEQAAKTLSRLYGPGQIEVPIGAALEAAARNRAIANHPGSHNDAAKAFKVTRRWVRMVRRAERDGPGPLFEGLPKRP